MNKEKALDKGLVYTGFYSRYKSEALEEVEKLRKLGYVAHWVTIPCSEYARSADRSSGYAVYAERNYSLDMEAARVREKIQKHSEYIQALKEEYETKVAECEKEHQRRLDWMKEHCYTII